MKKDKIIYNLELLVVIITAITFLIAILLIFNYTPIEKSQGIVQKIFYFHVPSAWVTFLAFFIVMIASIFYLWKKSFIADIIAYSSAEVGIVFNSLVLLTGPLWGKPSWGTWWIWDSRLTTTLILWFIYMAYLMLRKYGGEGEKISRYCAVLGIIGAFDIPIIYYSVILWRTIHPKPLVSTLEPEMLKTLLISILAFTLLYILLMFLNGETKILKDRITSLRSKEI